MPSRQWSEILQERSEKVIQPKYHVFVCTSCRPNGVQKGLCATKGSPGLVQRFVEEIEDNGLETDVLLTNTGCFGICDKGPVVVVYPEGIWYGNVDDDSVGKIVESHFKNGVPVKEFMI